MMLKETVLFLLYCLKCKQAIIDNEKAKPYYFKPHATNTKIASWKRLFLIIFTLEITIVMWRIIFPQFQNRTHTLCKLRLCYCQTVVNHSEEIQKVLYLVLFQWRSKWVLQFDTSPITFYLFILKIFIILFSKSILF